MTQANTPADDATRQPMIRLQCCPPARTSKTEETVLSEKLEGDMTKAYITNLIHFRSGHHQSLSRWQHLMGRTKEIHCRLCGEGEEHLWILHPALLEGRYHHQLGDSMEEPVRLPQACLAHLRTVLRLLPLLNHYSSSPTLKISLSRSVRRSLRTSNSLRPQTTVPTVCPRVRHHATQLPEHYLIATNLFKAFELWELCKAKHWKVQF